MADNNNKPTLLDKIGDVAEKALDKATDLLVGVPVAKNTELSVFPFGSNPVTLEYNNANKHPELTHTEAKLGVGGKGLQLRELVRTRTETKEIPDSTSSLTETTQYGLLTSHSYRSVSMLGNSALTAPVLSAPISVTTGTARGVGYAESAKVVNGDTGEAVTISLQLAAPVNSSQVEANSTRAPVSALSVSNTGRTSDKTQFAHGATVFVEHARLGVEVATARQMKLGENTTLNLSAEAIKSAVTNVKRVGGEISHPLSEATPYVSANITQANGSHLPDGVKAGMQKTLNLGAAKCIAETLCGFIQWHGESGQKPAVQIGLTAGDMSAGRTVRK